MNLQRKSNNIVFYYSLWTKIRQPFFGLLISEDTMIFFSESAICRCHIFCFFQNFSVFGHNTISSVIKRPSVYYLAAENIIVGA